MESLPSHERMVLNIAGAYEQAVESPWYDEGRTWYRTAASLAETMAGSRRRGAGVIAAFSPAKSWVANTRLAQLAFLTGCAVGHVHRVCRQAQYILDGGDPLVALRGPKVTNFFLAINEPDSSYVCIDRHAIRIACGSHLSERDGASALRRIGYFNIAEAYREAARWFHQPATVIQSTTWCWYRGVGGDKAQLTLNFGGQT